MLANKWTCKLCGQKNFYQFTSNSLKRIIYEREFTV